MPPKINNNLEIGELEQYLVKRAYRRLINEAVLSLGNGADKIIVTPTEDGTGFNCTIGGVKLSVSPLILLSTKNYHIPFAEGLGVIIAVETEEGEVTYQARVLGCDGYIHTPAVQIYMCKGGEEATVQLNYESGIEEIYSPFKQGTRQNSCVLISGEPNDLNRAIEKIMPVAQAAVHSMTTEQKLAFATGL